MGTPERSRADAKPIANAPGRLSIDPKEGRAVWLGGIGVVFKLFGNDTGGAFSIVEHPLKPRTLVPPHMHDDTDEFSIVVGGRIGARIGNEVVEATPGCYVLKPRGIPHTFWNPGDEPARIIELISPPGFEQFFDEAAKLFEAGEPPTAEQIGQIASRYHTALGWGDWIPELSSRYKLKLFGL